MTDRPSDRELLRRVVANDDAMRDGSHIEHLLPHFDERKAIIEAIRARLAEPEENVALVSIQVLEDFKTAREEITTLRARLAEPEARLAEVTTARMVAEQEVLDRDAAIAQLRADLAALEPLARAGLNAAARAVLDRMKEGT